MNYYYQYYKLPNLILSIALLSRFFRIPLAFSQPCGGKANGRTHGVR